MAAAAVVASMMLAACGSSAEETTAAATEAAEETEAEAAAEGTETEAAEAPADGAVWNFGGLGPITGSTAIYGRIYRVVRLHYVYFFRERGMNVVPCAAPNDFTAHIVDVVVIIRSKGKHLGHIQPVVPVKRIVPFNTVPYRLVISRDFHQCEVWIFAIHGKQGNIHSFFCLFRFCSLMDSFFRYMDTRCKDIVI